MRNCPHCGRPDGPPPPQHGEHGCCKHGGNSFEGALLWTLVGVALGMLYAPKTGKETREQLKEEATKMKDKAEPIIENAKEKIGPMLAQAQEKAGPIVDDIKEKVNEALEDLDDMNRKRAKEKKSFFKGIN